MPTPVWRPRVLLGIYGALSAAPFLLERGDAGDAQLGPAFAFAATAIVLGAFALSLAASLPASRLRLFGMLRAWSP
ncbi:MAG: hypothetical protein JOY59_07740, partial [Candidatus Eremiobacteraeota bacterium]|nr:hypothetical protein [Candidatus Eremiobacteraeota bacterium]